MPHVASPVERVLDGPGARAELGAELERLGRARVVLVSSRSLAQSSPFARELELQLGGRHQATFTGFRQHTPSEAVAELAGELRRLRADAVVSLGGGSVIDGCKAAVHEAGSQGIDHLALPTTLSGAEFTASAGVTDPESRQKRSVLDRGSAPRVVFLDPQLGLTTPSPLWLGSGVRALDHAAETLLSPVRDPLADHLALAALTMLREALPACRAQPGDQAAIHRAQLAAWWAALGLASVPMGPSHLLGKLLGAPFGIPHGVTSCVLLPVVLAQTAERDPERVSRLAQPFGVELAGEVAGALRQLVAGLGLPTSLEAAGLSRADLPHYLETLPEEWREPVAAAY